MTASTTGNPQIHSYLLIKSAHLSLVLITASYILGGCSGSRGTLDRGDIASTGFPNHTVEQVTMNLSMLSSPIEAYQAESALSVRSPIQSGSFSASIQHRKNDSLLISISPGFGIIAVRALVTPDSFYIHDRINKELTYGSIEAMRQLLPLPVTSSALYAAMLGLLKPDRDTTWKLTANKEYYIIKDPQERISYTIDPLLWRVLRYEERDAAGNLIEERTFSEFEAYDGVYLPRRLTFRRPGDDTAASLYYRKLTINPEELSLDFNVNPTVRRTSF